MATMKAPDTITAIEGYDAMRVFRETVWRRHDTVEEIAFVLGSLKWADGRRRYRVARENMTFYCPPMTCLLVSVLFSLVFWVVNR
jgi:hypothetical protein